MKTTLFSLEIIALLVLTLIPWRAPSIFKLTCSRDDSKIVRHVIATKWLPILEKYQVKLPLECPFHPQRDVFGALEAARRRPHAAHWTCGFCGKSFYQEQFLDLHFDQRHANHINKAEDAVCLADYCDMMRCGVVSRAGVFTAGESSGDGGGGSAVTELAVWRGQDHSVVLPAPTSLAPTSMLRLDKGSPQDIQPLDCPKTSLNDQVVDHTTKEEDDSDTNDTSEVCEAESAKGAEGAEEGGAGAEGAGAAGRGSSERVACDPLHLQALKLHCERTVHACVAALALHLTHAQFLEMEDELQRSVCWYLSCERYWEEGTPRPRTAPWPLLLALATGLALALSMCYYIVWIVFESEEALSVSGSGSVPLSARSSPSRAGRAPDPDDYIYVTYPPELKRRLLDSCYNRTTRL